MSSIKSDLEYLNWHRKQLVEHRRAKKELLKRRGIKEPLRCPSCGTRGKTEEHQRICSGSAWYTQDEDGRPPGIATALWIAYQRDLIVKPLFDMTQEEARSWYDEGGITA